MKKIILLLAVALLAFPAYASKEEKVAALMKLMNADATLNVAYDQALGPLSCYFVLTPAEEATVKADLIRTLDGESFVKTLAGFWIQNYTEQELDEILKFYQTSAGKKQITLMPEYTKFMLDEQRKWSSAVMPKMVDLAKRIEQKYPQRSGAEADACIKQKQGK